MSDFGPYVPPPSYGGYGPPSGYPVHRGGFPPRVAIERRANPAGIVLAMLGGIVALFGALMRWYPGPVGLREIVRVLDQPGAKAFPKAYFGWLIWVVLGVTVVVAVFANVAGPLSTALRVLAPISGAVGAILVCAALSDLIVGDRSIFDHARAGLWLVLAGFVLAGIGGVLGPRRVRPGPVPGSGPY